MPPAAATPFRRLSAQLARSLASAAPPGLRLLLCHVRRQFDLVWTLRWRRGVPFLRCHAYSWASSSRWSWGAWQRWWQQQHRPILFSLAILNAPHTAQGPSFDWSEQRIPSDSLVQHRDDLSEVSVLRAKTLTCANCGRRHVIDTRLDGVAYCQCPERKSSVYGVAVQDEDVHGWTPFLERKDILVWRKEYPPNSGLYAYKMYGKFSDVTAHEFLEVQLDMSEFRLTWDENTAQCHVLESEEADGSGSGSGSEEDESMSQIYYWEVNWPRFFSNRDYVCNRRAKIFEKEQVAVVYSASTAHPQCPPKDKTVRVENYWSVMTVRPAGVGSAGASADENADSDAGQSAESSPWDRNGVEFCLTAFENPGVRLPASVTTWVAIRGMPEFMLNLRRACLRLREWDKQPRLLPASKRRQLQEQQQQQQPEQQQQQQAEVFVNVRECA